MYYLRARYYKPDISRFWTMDSYEGSQGDPLSLHKYLYCNGEPVNGVDPSGHETLTELSCVEGIMLRLASQTARAVARAYAKNVRDREWMIWRVALPRGRPWRKHTFVWVQNIRSKKAYGYHVVADIETKADIEAAFANFIPWIVRDSPSTPNGPIRASQIAYCLKKACYGTYGEAVHFVERAERWMEPARNTRRWRVWWLSIQVT